MTQFLTRFMKNESGATAIEYGLIAAGIAAVIIVTVNELGGKVDGTFQSISKHMKTPVAPTP
jgi:pilus assembly protein Flp/PilA